jgi:hypothetical protein
MAKLNPAQFTIAGLNAAADLFAHQKANKVSHVSISKTNYIGTDVSKLNKLTNEILVVAPSAMSQSGNVYTITGVFDSSRISTDSTINSIGIYIVDNTNTEVLLAVVTASQPDFIPAGGAANQDSIVYSINIAVANSGITFELTIDDNAIAQMSDITDAKNYASSLVSTLDTTVVHNTGNEQVLGVKTFLNTIIGSIAGTATKWATARKLGVNLASATQPTIDGSADVTGIGVSGVLPVANGGTGSTTLTGLVKGNGTGVMTAAGASDVVTLIGSMPVAAASTANKLATAQQVAVNLASITPQTFDGSAPQTSIPVNGTLPFGNGGTGRTDGLVRGAIVTALTANTDLNTLTNTGAFYLSGSTVVNAPNLTYGQLFVSNTGGSGNGEVTQLIVGVTGIIYTRAYSGSPAAWTPWRTLFDNQQIIPVVNGGTGNNTGNATTATKLATSRIIALTGDVTSSASFDGSGNATGTATLANSGVTAGTYPKVTVDAKGRVTTGAALAVSDVPTLNQDTTGNAGTATKWQTARTVALTGDVTWSASLDGSTNISSAATLASVTQTNTTSTQSTTYSDTVTIVDSVTRDTKGRVTGINLNTVTMPAAQVSITGNAGTATKLTTARNLGVNLASTTAQTFDGSAAQTNLPVSGVLPIANGGTGRTDGLVRGSYLTALAANTDLNTLTNTGAFYIGGSEVVNAPNAPYGQLFVSNTGGSGNGEVTQLIVGVTGIIYTRAYSGSPAAWTPWRTLFDNQQIIPVVNGGTGVTTLTGLAKGNGTGAMTAAVAGTDYLGLDSKSTTAIVNLVYPIGSYYTSNNPTDPATLFGVGTWVRVKGRVLVGVDEADTALANPDLNGGSTNPLTAHNHTLRMILNGALNSTTDKHYGLTYGSPNTWRTGDLATITDTQELPASETGAVAKTAGDNTSHANWQPFRTAYMWERTA